MRHFLDFDAPTMQDPIGADPYRSVDTSTPTRHRFADGDVLIAVGLLSPAFLAVVVRTIARGEVFGAGPTICGALVVLAAAMSISAWRARG